VEGLTNGPPITNTFRPYRAGRRVDLFLGLKPQAESYRPCGTKPDGSGETDLIIAALTQFLPGLRRAQSTRYLHLVPPGQTHFAFFLGRILLQVY